MKNKVKFRYDGYILMVFGICLFLIMCGSTQALAGTTTDLGHGSGCQHTHSSGCYSHTHSYSCLNAHNWMYYRNDPSFGYCSYCAGNQYIRGYTYNCSKCNLRSLQEQCVGCGAVTYDRNYNSYCSVSGCSIPTTDLICSKVGYTDCIKPSTTIHRSIVGWTNQDVTCTGQCPTFTFTDGNPQTVVFTSSSGHRVQETITSNVDKLVPEQPIYALE